MTITLTTSTLAVDTETIDAADVTTVDNQLLTHINNIHNGAQQSEKHLFTELAADPSAPASGQWYLYFKATGLFSEDDAGNVNNLSLSKRLCQLRLTLTTATPVTTSDVTAATHVYVTPYHGNTVSLYNGSSWDDYSASEIDIDIAGFTASKPFDVFVYVSSGSVVAETLVWTDDSNRATALVLQDGTLVKSGATSHLYVGTFRTTSVAGQTEDSKTKRLVWNNYNRVLRPLLVYDTTDSWTYATATWHAWNASTGNRVAFVVGVAEDSVLLTFNAGVAATSAAGSIAIAPDSTTVPLATAISRQLNTASGMITATHDAVLAAGYHYLQLLEFANSATATFVGDAGGTAVQSAASGHIMA